MAYRTLEELKENYEYRLESCKSRYGASRKTDKNGTLYFYDYRCQRCGGVGGADQWVYTGYTCYECGGSGISNKPDVIKVYLPEYEAKLEARRKARDEKKQAEHEAKIDDIRKEWLVENGWTEDGYTYIFLGDTYAMRSDIKALGGRYNGVMGWFIDHEVAGYEMLKVNMDGVLDKSYWGYDYIASAPIKELKAQAEKELHPETHPSEYIGEVGKRLKGLKLTITFETEFCYHKGSWDERVSFFYTMVDEQGNIFTWKASSPIGIVIDDKWNHLGKGDTVVLDGTVKEHKEYKGDKQTVLTRCKVQGV